MKFIIIICLLIPLCSVLYAHDEAERKAEFEKWHAEQHAGDAAEDVADDLATILDTFTLGFASAAKSAWDLAKEALPDGFYSPYLCSSCETYQQGSHICYEKKPDDTYTINIDDDVDTDIFDDDREEEKDDDFDYSHTCSTCGATVTGSHRCVETYDEHGRKTTYSYSYDY